MTYVNAKKLPAIIQGGMGVGVSGWKLARASSLAGATGTVSGTAVANILARSLQKGDLSGDYRRALSAFPFPAISKIVLDKYFVDGGSEKQKEIPMWDFEPAKILIALTICANFSFVWLAKEGYDKPVFINYLEKIQMPHIYSLVGAMLAGVDGVVMGAGIPKHIPDVINSILNGGELIYPINVVDHPDKFERLSFNPKEFFGANLPELKRPLFFPIVTSHVLAKSLVKSLKGRIDGFIVELNTAGGHNAPPRGQLLLDQIGQPIYGIRDGVDFFEFKKLDLPFWIGGSFASPLGLKKAFECGANGIQVGSIFAFCDESGISEYLKQEAKRLIYRNCHNVFTSSNASPTGYPFKIFQMSETISDDELYNNRKRICSLGYLREAVWKEGDIIWRCAAEPVEDYIRKGGEFEKTKGCVCVCAGLCATIGIRDWEIPLLTSGDDLACVYKCMNKGSREWNENSSYSAKDAIDYISGMF